MITRPVASIVDEPATTAEFDPMVAWLHVTTDRLRLVRLGAVDRYYSLSDGYIQFDATLCGRPKLRVIVKLMPDDTYAVEVARIRSRAGNLVYTPLAQERDLFCGNVGEAMENLVEHVWSVTHR